MRRQTEDKQMIIERTRDALLKEVEKRGQEHEAYGHESGGDHRTP